jgi:hypothetical protein
MVMRGLMRSWGEASHNFTTTFRDEIPVFAGEAIGKHELRSLDVKGPSISGLKGRIIRVPWRTLSSADDYMMTVLANGEAMARAYRKAANEKAANEGLVDEALERRMMELYNDRASEAWVEAYDRSLNLTFKERGRIVDALLGVRRKIPGFRYIMPYVTTLVDLMGKGVRHTPLSALALLNDFRKRDYSQTSLRTAEQLLAWGTLATFVASIDPEDPWITGSRGPHRYTIKLLGKRFSYQRIDPFATALGIMADMAYAIQQGQPWTVIQEPFAAAVKMMDQKTMMQAMSDLMNVFDSIKNNEVETIDALLKFASNTFTGFVPNIVRAPIRATQETIPERRVYGARMEKTTKFLERTVKGMEMFTAFSPDHPKIDLAGRDRMRDGAPIGGPMTDFLWRLFVPTQASHYNETAMDRLIYNWNRLHPEEPYNPRGSNPWTKIKGKKVWLSNEQFAEFQRRRGRFANELIVEMANNGAVDTTNPKERDRDILQDVFRDGTGYAKDTMIQDGLIEVPN